MNVNAHEFPRRHRVTVDEYHRMGNAGIFSEDDRLELIEGEIIDMAPIETRHAESVSRLARLFIKGSTAVVRVRDPIRLQGQSEPQPDLAVVSNRSYLDAHPGPEDVHLLIEVADTSLTYDRTVKVPLNARHGIPEVWLIDLPGETVEVYREPSPDGYRHLRRYGPGQRIQSLRVPEVELDPVELFR